MAAVENTMSETDLIHKQKLNKIGKLVLLEGFNWVLVGRDHGFIHKQIKLVQNLFE